MNRPEMSATSLLLVMGGATLVMTMFASILIVVPTMLWLAVAYGSLLVVVALVGLYLLRLIDTDDRH